MQGQCNPLKLFGTGGLLTHTFGGGGGLGR